MTGVGPKAVKGLRIRDRGHWLRQRSSPLRFCRRTRSWPNPSRKRWPRFLVRTRRGFSPPRCPGQTRETCPDHQRHRKYLRHCAPPGRYNQRLSGSHNRVGDGVQTHDLSTRDWAQPRGRKPHARNHSGHGLCRRPQAPSTGRLIKPSPNFRS